jgi:phage-related protein
MANDNYVILRRGPNGQYSPISKSMRREEVDTCVALLKVNQPGKYLLLNLQTNIIEEWNDTTGRNANGRSRART